jgi:undecaprenyl-diphosphatase
MEILDWLRHFDFRSYLFFYHMANSHPWLSYFYFYFAKYGIILIFLSFVYLIYKKTINAFICSLLAMAIAGTASFLINIFWQRPHPFESHFGEIIQPIINGLRISASSFPSIHTYIAFAIAVSIFLYGHRRLGTVLFIIAILIGLSRIGTGLHYPTDIVAGAVIGIISGIVAFRIVHRYQRNWD